VLLLGRQSNYVTVYIKNVDVKRDEVFKSVEAFDHLAIGFKKFNSYPSLVWGLMIKKKKFDLIISKSQWLRSVLGLIGQRTAVCLDDHLIAGLKKVS